MQEQEHNVERMVWDAIGAVISAHAVMLRDAAVVDDGIAGAILTALDGVRRGDPPANVAGVSSLAAAFDDRLDSLVAPAAAGTTYLGRGRAETAAATIRLVLRNELLAFAPAVRTLRAALLDLASAHVFTLMPAHGQGRPVQPTSLAHWLGGTIGPLGRVLASVQPAFAQVNQSPLGAAAMAATPLPVDRDRTAGLLGFDGLVLNTLDAVAAVDHLPVALAPVSAVTSIVRRLLTEFAAWDRAEPGSIRFGTEWMATGDPNLPHYLPAAGLHEAIQTARGVEQRIASATVQVDEIAYGPVGSTLDTPFTEAILLFQKTSGLIDRTTRLLTSGFEINRASLAIRAGRDHITSADLATMLIVEEGLDPASARTIAAMTIQGALAEGVEASGIMPAAIDAAALLVIGREVGIEIERMGSYLAPRRFLEKRGAPGGPAPEAVRDYIDRERGQDRARERWHDDTMNRMRGALASLEAEVSELLRVE